MTFSTPIFFYLGIANQTVASHHFQKNKLPKALNCRQFHPSPEDLLRGGKARRAEYWENFTFAESLALEVDIYIYIHNIIIYLSTLGILE